MRITGGRAKGIPLRAPKNPRIRPTSDKVREALFATLPVDISRAKVLDLFAGSGALAIEALSRGAERALLVEQDNVAARTIETNLERTGLSGKAEIIRADFRSALRKLKRRGEGFDLVFIDPPYQSDLIEEAARVLAKYRVVSCQATIVVEHFKKMEPPTSISGIPHRSTRFYGQTALSYYQTE